MKITIVLLAALLHPLGASTYAPDLCADAHLNTNGEPITDLAGVILSRFCEWTGPSAPVWDTDVCCTVSDEAARCSPTNIRGACASGMKVYCEYGEVLADDSVICYQPFPSACGSEPCADPLPFQASDYIQEDLLCCQNGDCWEWDAHFAIDCEGYLSWCQSGYLNEDGSVDCYD